MIGSFRFDKETKELGRRSGFELVDSSDGLGGTFGESRNGVGDSQLNQLVGMVICGFDERNFLLVNGQVVYLRSENQLNELGLGRICWFGAFTGG